MQVHQKRWKQVMYIAPWNEWGDAASAHETYGTEMQSYLLGEQDLDTTLKNVDSAVKELLEK